MLLVPFLLHAQAAQTPKAQGPKDDPPPADFTGVWYPSSGSTLGAATPDNPGQQFVWLDSEGKPLKGPLPLTAWGQERLKANHPTGPKTSAIDSDDPDFQCFPSGVPRIYLFLYPMELIHTPGRVLMLFEYGHNDKTWLGYGGQPHSEALHVTERIRRIDHESLMIDITLDDPKAYTMPLHTQKKYILKPDWNLMEFVCEDNSLNFLEFEKKTRIQK
jgi:hypothetical protein